jgi:hypothetical protein
VFLIKINSNNDVGCSFGKKSLGQMVSMLPAAIDQYETTASLVGFQRLSKKILLGKRYIGDVIKTNMFYQEESVYLQEFAYFKQDCCRIKRIIKYCLFWYRNG